MGSSPFARAGRGEEVGARSGQPRRVSKLGAVQGWGRRGLSTCLFGHRGSKSRVRWCRGHGCQGDALVVGVTVLVGGAHCSGAGCLSWSCGRRGGMRVTAGGSGAASVAWCYGVLFLGDEEGLPR